ncbi:MAG: alpha/beta hydrolase [Nocardioides sp.]
MFSTITLADGRTLEYAEHGDPSGSPLFFFHGTPATGGQAACASDIARSRGVRLVAPTRPGYGDSTMGPPGLSRTASDTLELADELGLERFGVWGTSGGGPFALAVAALAPERMTLVAVHAGPGRSADVRPEVVGDEDTRALDLVAGGRFDEGIAVMNALGDAEFDELRGLSAEDFSAAMAKMTPPGESWFDRHPEHRGEFEADFQRSIVSSDGFSRDNLSWLRDWDIDPSTISVPVRLVYGESDQMAIMAHAEWLQARLPSSELVVVPGGHGDAIFGAADATFAALETH